MKNFNFLLMLIFLLTLSCSKEDDLKYQIYSDENFKVTLEDDFTLNLNVEPTRTSTLLSHQEIYDNVNDTTWKYSVLLPPDFNASKKYPVLYLLHQRGGTEQSITEVMHLKATLDFYYSNGLFDMVVICPSGLDTYYMDGVHENIKYETFFHEVFRPYIEEKYYISKEKSERFIGGMSMGAYGSVFYSLKYYKDFSFCYAMSGPLKGNDQFNVASLYRLFEEKANAGDLPYFIFDIGKSDQYFQINLDTHWVLYDLSIKHELIIRDGGHDVAFWTKGCYLLFDRLGKFFNPLYKNFN